LNRDAEFVFQYFALPIDYIRHPPQLHIPQDAQFLKLREEFRERFAGIYITRLYPERRVSVHLSGDAPVAGRKLQFGDDVMIVDFVHGHEHSAEDMENAINTHWGELARAFTGLQDAGVDGSAGEVVLYIYTPDGSAEKMEKMRSLAQEILQIPVRINAVSGQATLLH